MAPRTTKHFGKYRGQVLNNIDPLGQGRLQVSVAHFPGLKLGWAMPCMPWAGSGVGFYAVPPRNANVWVEFEGGDLGYPIWSGCFWEGTNTVPGGDPLTKPLKKIFKTEFLTMEMDDTPGKGGITIEASPGPVKTPLKIKMDAAGILIDAAPGKITITPTKIEIQLPPGSATFDPKQIAIKLGEPGVTIAPAAITLKHGPSSVEVTPTAIDAKNGASGVNVAPAAVGVKSGVSKIDVSASGINSSSGVAKASVGAAGTSLAHGAASVELKVASVSVNKKALEVV